ncbi:ssl1498 family light-harvesting-like protein [Leptolyngbya boryana CZ1]|nr:ssl1498 family light-harvesting-like protein [Leptolyngbya boryana]WNZ48475.1 ssl1498 family light-harvesting-like protein [Leptolyngbya boryana CZ1]
MYTTRNEDGILNNYPSEPVMYFAEFPSSEQQQTYVTQGAIAVLLITFTFLMALAASY